MFPSSHRYCSIFGHIFEILNFKSKAVSLNQIAALELYNFSVLYEYGYNEENVKARFLYKPEINISLFH